MERKRGRKGGEKVPKHQFSREESSEQDGDFLKREIASHGLYGLLLQSHFECLKLCLHNNVDDPGTVLHPITVGGDGLNVLQSELDQFMEAYCVALNKLKGAIEESQQESMAFISDIYSQLEELVEVPSSTDVSASD